MADGNEEGKVTKEKILAAIKELNKAEKKELLAALGASGVGSFLTDKDISRAEDYNRVLQATAAAMGDLEGAAKAQQILLEESFLDKVKDAFKGQEILGKKIKEAEEALSDFKKGNKDALSDLTTSLGIDPEEMKRMQEALQYTQDMIEGVKIYGAETDKVAGKVGGLFGLQEKYSSSTLGSLTKLSAAMKEGGEQQRLAQLAFKNSMSEMFNIGNIGLNIFSALKDINVQMFKNFDSASAALAKSTGQGRKFQETMYDVSREGNQFGISMDNAQAAIGTLVDQTSNFTNLSKSTAQNIALTVAQMEKLGVSTADSAKIFQNFNQGLGISAEESAKMQVELAMAGTSIGISSAKITKDFNASLSTLMVYGRESLDVFKGLAAAAKAAGVETSTLLGIAGKFDTFAGAAEGVGKLNALLGTQLSTTEMLMATEDERIKMLVESVQAGGVAFKDMDRFQQKAIANAAGITDMAEANRIFGMSLEAYEENERKLKASADAQKKMEEALAPTVKLMDTMKILGQELVVALKPVIEKIQELADYAREAFGDMSTETKELIGFGLLLASGFMALVPIFAAGGTLVMGLATTAGTLGMMAGASTATAGGITATATAAAAATPALAGMAAPLAAIAAELGVILGPIALIAIGIGIATIAFAGFAYAVVELLKPVVGIVADFLNFIYDGLTGIGSAIAAAFSTSDADVAIEGFRTRSVEAMADIVMSIGTDDSVVERTAAMVAEINKLGQDVKVSSTIENLALLTAGTATSITGEKVKTSTTNVTAKVQNFFEGMQMTLSVDGAEFKGYVENVSEKVAGEVVGGERVV
jgi:hypothetical protein